MTHHHQRRPYLITKSAEDQRGKTKLKGLQQTQKYDSLNNKHVRGEWGKDILESSVAGTLANRQEVN